MLLHSIAAFEQVFPPPPGATVSYKPVHGGMVEGMCENGSFTVSRLISTDPRAYLDPRYAPGGRLQ